MDSAAPMLIGLGVVLLWLLLMLGLPAYAVINGFRRRRRTQQLLAAGEPALAHLVCTNTETRQHSGATALVLGNVAYAADAPSRIAAQWRMFFGGTMESMTMQADLARRLAVLRMLQDAQRVGATGVTNVRVETSEVFSGGRSGQRMVLELVAYGTALVR